MTPEEITKHIETHLEPFRKYVKDRELFLTEERKKLEEDISKLKPILKRAYSSELTGNLSDALAKAQGEFKDLVKSAKVSMSGRPTYSYSTLDDIKNACQEALSKNKISVTFTQETDDNGAEWMITRLQCGEQWREGRVSLTANKNEPQKRGSEYTYMKRYVIQGMLFLNGDDDDDAQEAMKTKRI